MMPDAHANVSVDRDSGRDFQLVLADVTSAEVCATAGFVTGGLRVSHRLELSRAVYRAI